jgi:ribosomal protein S18 acetylase RimI-like enzyme
VSPTIRVACATDAGAVLALARPFATSFAIDERAFHQSYAALLASTEARLLVAESERGIVGYLLGVVHHTFFANGRVASVEEIMVEESCRRQGVGEMLMREFEAWARARECRLVSLATRRASAFYAAIGYEESAVYFRKLL